MSTREKQQATSISKFCSFSKKRTAAPSAKNMIETFDASFLIMYSIACLLGRIARAVEYSAQDRYSQKMTSLLFLNLIERLQKVRKGSNGCQERRAPPKMLQTLHHPSFCLRHRFEL